MNGLSWEINVPIFKNRLILKQLFIAIGIPFGILIIFLLFIKAYEGIFLIAITFVLTFLLVKFMYKGTYDVSYVVNKKGVLCETQSEQKKRVKVLSQLTFLLGLFAKNPTAAGAGLLSGSKTSVEIPWKRVRKVKIVEKQSYFLIYGGFAENIALFCNEDNFSDVKQLIDELYLKNQ